MALPIHGISKCNGLMVGIQGVTRLVYAVNSQNSLEYTQQSTVLICRKQDVYSQFLVFWCVVNSIYQFCNQLGSALQSHGNNKDRSRVVHDIEWNGFSIK